MLRTLNVMNCELYPGSVTFTVPSDNAKTAEAAEKATAAESKALDDHVLIVEGAAGDEATGEDADCAGIIVEGAAGGEAAGEDADCAAFAFGI